MKRAISLALCFALCASAAFTGCSQKTQTSGTSSSGGETQAESSDDGLTPVGTYPITNQKITVSIMVPAPSDSNTDYNTNALTKELEERTNIHIDWQLVQSDFPEKVNLVVASGEYPDVIDTGAGKTSRITKSTELQLGTQKIIIPLEDIIDEDMPNYKQLMDNDSGILRTLMTTPDEHIYNLAMINASYHTTYPEKMWINTAWLDQLGLSMPTTPDEFEQVLLAFKNDDPNGNGQADEIPLSTVKSGSNVNLDGFLMNAFTYTPASDDRLYLKDGKVTLSAVQSGYKEGLKYLNKLYEEGLINSESFTQDNKTQVNKNESGSAAVIGAFPALRIGYACNLSPVNGVTSTRWQEYDAVPPLKGPDGLQVASYDPYNGSYPEVYITKSCENPAAVCRMFDYIYSEEGTVRANTGREGKEWEKADADDVGYDGQPAKYKSITVDTTQTEYQNVSYGQLLPLGATLQYCNEWAVPTDPYDSSIPALSGRMVVFYNATKTYEPYSPGIDAVLPDLYYAESDVDQISRQKTTINSYIDEQVTAFITGKTDIDSGWDSYVSQLDSMGLQTYLDLMQKAYDNQYGTK